MINAKDLKCCQDPHQVFTNEIKEFNNIIIGPGGIILSEEGDFIDGANLHYEYWCSLFKRQTDNDKYSIWYKKEKELKNIRKLEGKYIFALGYFDNYEVGHIWDTFQSLRPFQNSSQYNDRKLICHLNNGKLYNYDFHFSVFGFNKERLIQVENRNKFYLVENILIPQPAMYMAHISNYNFKWIINNYISAIKLQPPLYKVIYCSRGSSRQAINEDEIKIFCQKNNVKYLTGLEPIDELISYFYHAKLIFGLHGSFLRYCIFNNKNAKAVEFQPHNRGDHAQQVISLKAGVDYIIMKVSADSKFRAEIPLDYIEYLMRKISNK